MPSPSPRGVLSGADLLKVLKGALIAGAGVALARLADMIPGLDLGTHGDLIAAALMIVINVLRKLIGGPAKA